MSEAVAPNTVVVEEQPLIEVDENDSTLGDDDFIGSTRSLDSTIEAYDYHVTAKWYRTIKLTGKVMDDGTTDFVLENMLSPTMKENDREDMKHHATRLLLSGRLQITEFEKSPAKVLDIGTGTGIWAIDFADDHPASHVIGVDLSPIQPSLVPPNLEFQIDDIEDEWTWQPATFDFVNIRYMASAIKNWPRLLEQAKTSMTPGAKIELVDMDIHYQSDDGTVTESNKFLKFINDIIGAGPKLGIDLDICNTFEDMLSSAGFKNIYTEIYKLPMGPWPKDRRLKEIGYFHRTQFLQGITGIAMGLYGRGMGWTMEEIEVMLAGVRKDIENKRIHGYWTIQFTTAEAPRN